MRVVIETAGTRLSFDNGVLIVEDRQENKITEIPFLHITSLHLHPRVRVTTDVLNYCITSGIPVFLENRLEIIGMIWSPQYGSISEIRKKQTLLSLSPLRWNIIKKALIRKNTERIRQIHTRSTRPEIPQKLQEIQTYNTRIANATDPETIRSAEALTGKIFFEIFATLLPARCPMERREHPNATNPVNIFLNYGYGILYKEITKSLIQAGLDPFTGFFHRDQYNRPAFTYDMIEPYRPWIEFRILQFCKKKITEPPQIPGGKLPDNLRKKLIEHILIFLDKTKIRWNGKIKTPRTHIQLDMYKIAQYIQNLNHETLLDSLRHIQ